MASLVARAASLPSGRAGLLGSGRLSLPGHGALVLAGRRVGVGHGGVLALQFMAPAPARDVKVACHPAPKTVINDDEDDEFERIYIGFIHKVERLHASGELLIGLPLPPAAVSDEEKAVQEKLKEIAEGCIGLHADAMRRLVLKQRLRMYPIFWAVLLSFATVAAAAKEGRCSWGLAWAIADNLDALRRMVSRGCDAPLRLPWVMRVPVADAERHLPPAHFWGALIKVADATDPDCKFTAIDSCEEVMLTLLGRLYTATKYDVDAMISVAPPA
ncbi:uncharacterized protein LOC120674934 [Panicum virgatum]|uniref:Uncharacterized protein n=1 Tax=Panicum virgatum TaxID=38727 RepID=A0A8T0S087_PANVG|nr:uncharacterized protein LOC120674934 [Panicum virgatum]KAG2591094.1 hypothetical protein PVAP13_5NG444600 [Panicum virgatum]